MKKIGIAFLVAAALASSGCARWRAPDAAFSSGRDAYGSMVSYYARMNGVPEDLALAVVQNESSFNPSATGAVGEIGLTQIRYTTAQGLGYTGSARDLYSPEINLAYGMAYLGEAYRRGGGTVCGTMMKYQAGLYATRETDSTRLACSRVAALMRVA